MQGREQISSPASWPADPLDRIERAHIDLEFVRVMNRIGFKSAGLNRIAIVATVHRRRAMQEIMKEYGHED